MRHSTKYVRNVAFWINTLYSPFVRWSDIAKEFLSTKDDPEDFQNFVNSWLAEPWEDTKLKTNAELVMERQTDVPAYVIPLWTKLLTAGVDVQENSLYWTIRAWGNYLTSQNVAHGQALSFEEIDRVMNAQYMTEEGDPVVVNLCLVDSGDQTDMVYDFCAYHTDYPIKVTMGSGGRMYAMNVQANSQYDAELQAAAKANEANRKIQTMTITMAGNPNIVATQCVDVSGFGSYDSKYYVDSVKHSIGSSGYRTTITLHKVQPAIKVTAPAPAASGGQTYTVVSGDTLWGISKKFYGSGTKYGTIYNANKDLIESTAKSHGKKSSDNGHWIWPGETLTIP